MAALKDLIEGKPLRCPLHPALVHLPIALFPLSVALDLLSRFASPATNLWVKTAFITLLIGIGTALVAAVAGIVDYTDIRDDHPAKKTATAHLILNLIAVGLFAASAGLRFSNLQDTQVATTPLILSLAGLALLGYSGYLGGVLVYDDGIGVGRHRRRTRLPQTTVTVKTDGQPAVIGAAGDLDEGASLRVSVDGNVATVVRIKEGVFAFQEFCPHRYGPLSEGKIDGCEVTCPWHASRFDVRSGKVLAGPAKVDLRTYRVEERDGKLWIHPAA